MKEGITIAGTIAVDEIKKIEKYPNQSELTAIKSVTRSIGGAVSNCAVSLAKIDGELPINTVAMIGEDERGDYLKERLSHYKNIDSSQVKVFGDTPFTDVYQDATSRTFFTYKGNALYFDESKIDYQQLRTKIFHLAYILLLDGLDKEDKEYGTKTAKVLRNVQELGIKTSIDIVSENSDRYQKLVPPCLKFTNYCIINELEAGNSVGIALRNEDGKLIEHNIRKVLYRLKKLGVKDWVVIHTPEGSFGFDGKEIHSIPSLLIDNSSIKGTVGAGDAYVSGVLYGALKAFSLWEAMQLGTAAAASSLFEADGTSGVKAYDELVKMYQEYPKRNKVEI